MSVTILIVEDEPDMLSILQQNLTRENYTVRTAENGRDALRLAHQNPLPGLIVLDLMLPDISGLEICRTLRHEAQTQNIPILMLTAKSEDYDRITGLAMGADDYLCKPFNMQELLLRIQAILRRSLNEEAVIPVGEILFGALKIDLEGHRVWSQDKEIELTAMEYKLLVLFIERKGRVQSREQLLNAVWGITSFVQTRTVDSHVKRLRKKLGESVGKYIKTVHGTGYRFRNKPPEPESEKKTKKKKKKQSPKAKPEKS